MSSKRHEIYEFLDCRGRVLPSGGALRNHVPFRKMDKSKRVLFAASISAAFRDETPAAPAAPVPAMAHFSMRPLPTTLLVIKMEESIATEPTTIKRRLLRRKLVQLKVPEMLRLLKLRLSQVKLPTVMHPQPRTSRGRECLLRRLTTKPSVTRLSKGSFSPRPRLTSHVHSYVPRYGRPNLPSS